MTQASTNETFYRQTNQVERANPVDANSVEFIPTTLPPNLSTNAKRIWVDMVNEYLRWTVDGIDIHTVADRNDLGYVIPQWFGAVADGVTDDTQAYLDAAATGLPIYVPETPLPYMISSVINVTNSVIGIGMPEIRMLNPTGSITKIMIHVQGYNGGDILHVTGLHLNGMYDGVGVLDEQSHCVKVTQSSNVHVHHNRLNSPYGDCAYVGSDSIANSSNVHFYSNTMINPRRCCVAIVGASGVWVKDNDMFDTTAYVACIDIEPNSNSVDVVSDVWILNNRFDVQQYFVNVFNPNAPRPITNVTVSGNKGRCDIFFRSSSGGAGVTQNVLISDNEAYDGYNNNRFLLTSLVPAGLMVYNNKDFMTGTNGWGITSTNNAMFVGNTIKAVRSVGIQLIDCQYCTISENTIEDVSSTSGTIAFNSASATIQIGHRITNNTIRGSNIAILYTGAASVDHIIDGNSIESSTRSVSFAGSATGSRVFITTNNIFTGAITGVFNVNNNSNISKGYVTSIAAAPNYIGQIAVVGAVIYMASNTTAAGDWRQISN